YLREADHLRQDGLAGTLSQFRSASTAGRVRKRINGPYFFSGSNVTRTRLSFGRYVFAACWMEAAVNCLYRSGACQSPATSSPDSYFAAIWFNRNPFCLLLVSNCRSSASFSS